MGGPANLCVLRGQVGTSSVSALRWAWYRLASEYALWALLVRFGTGRRGNPGIRLEVYTVEEAEDDGR